MDEGRISVEAEQCYNAASPVAKQIIAISTDNIGWFHRSETAVERRSLPRPIATSSRRGLEESSGYLVLYRLVRMTRAT